MAGHAMPPPLASACDPGFILGAERGVALSPAARSRIDPRDARRWLSMRVARDPLDLRAHVQRIDLLSDGQEPARLFGALVDLFLVLGDKGAALRQALVERTRHLLDPDDHAYLVAHLGSGLHPRSALPLSIGSVVARGVMGSCTLVTAVPTERPRAEADPYDDPFHVPPDAQA